MVAVEPADKIDEDQANRVAAPEVAAVRRQIISQLQMVAYPGPECSIGYFAALCPVTHFTIKHDGFRLAPRKPQALLPEFPSSMVVRSDEDATDVKNN